MVDTLCLLPPNATFFFPARKIMIHWNEWAADPILLTEIQHCVVTSLPVEEVIDNYISSRMQQRVQDSQSLPRGLIQVAVKSYDNESASEHASQGGRRERVFEPPLQVVLEHEHKC